MSDHFCSNINTCRMITTSVVVPDAKIKEGYVNEWCHQQKEKWNLCKRFNTKNELGFCPDFVVPDTLMSTEEIMDKFEGLH